MACSSALSHQFQKRYGNHGDVSVRRRKRKINAATFDYLHLILQIAKLSNMTLAIVHHRFRQSMFLRKLMDHIEATFRQRFHPNRFDDMVPFFGRPAEQRFVVRQFALKGTYRTQR